MTQLADGSDWDQSGEVSRGMLSIVADIAQNQPPSHAGSSGITARCLKHMSEIKAWLQTLTDRLSGASVVGTTQRLEFEEGIEYQRISLVAQHETLSVVSLYLTKLNYTEPQHFETILERLRTADKYDHLLRKYPAGVWTIEISLLTKCSSLNPAHHSLHNFLPLSGQARRHCEDS